MYIVICTFLSWKINCPRDGKLYWGKEKVYFVSPYRVQDAGVMC